MKEPNPILSKQEEQRLIEAIQKAEKNTSGEIRIHIEPTVEIQVMDRALEVFHDLEMHATDLRNGVLFYVAKESKKLAILGDKGIDEKVPANFWQSEIDLMTSHFKEGDFTTGLELAIAEVGEKLKAFFPYKDDDTNELTDTISKGE